ncbi:MAG TPA: hypothetical protein ENJ40_09450 [Thermosulfurimonas dismutans]|uniref:DUF8196 domain-containing protein n=1 Tax=Thermosulfurimonas dismutans TaxID=999894 RepID=A0A7C3GIL1_9BACT|nr:hypothetical protein [Thermosulfurimonas dismutans]
MERLERVERLLAELYPQVKEARKDLELLKDITSDLVMSILEERKRAAEERKRAAEERRRAAEELQKIRELRKSVSELKASIISHEKQMEQKEKRLDRLEKQMERKEKRSDRLEKRLERMEKQAEKDREWMRKKWGEMAQRLGTLTEDIFAPGIPYLAKSLGFRVKKRMLDVEYKKDGSSNQYDAIVVAEDETGQERVLVAEVKSRLRSEHFEEFRKKLENLVAYEPAYRGKILPVLASLKIPERLIETANRRGVLLVSMGGEYLEALNPEVLRVGKKGAAGET